MNIQQAKDGIKEAVRSYLDKDAAGNYLVGRARQRAIMLMGAPGIGKTAIMSQIAAEMDIGYIGYTITHHTRQSAIGLPYIERRSYGGREYSITEYTLSEIRHWLKVFVRRFFKLSQYKRSCVPNGPKVGTGGSLSPRGDYRAPSDGESAPWEEDLRNIPATDA